MVDPPLSSSAVTVAVGDSLTLSCTSRGSPPDTFTWRKDSGPIVQSTNITTVEHNSASAVFRADYSINNVTTSDNGTYTCTVTNPIGSDSETITVNVVGMFVIYVCMHIHVLHAVLTYCIECCYATSDVMFRLGTNVISICSVTYRESHQCSATRNFGGS